MAEHSTAPVAGHSVRPQEGRATRWRDVTGIVILDKRSGVTSNRALQEVRRHFRARKAGHTGSLDPLATGVLPICLGEATKLSGMLLDSDKTYEVTARLGASTDTGDATGEVTGRADWSRVDADHLHDAHAQFLGQIEQVPPMYSAIKQDGQRLYKLAREGKSVERPPRTVHIHELELLGIDGPEFRSRVRCSKGTYIRTLVEDIAKSLGSLAHVTQLRRIAAGPFSIDQSVTIEQLRDSHQENTLETDGYILNADAAVSGYPAIECDPDETHRILRGQRICCDRATEIGVVRLYGPEGRFLGMGSVADPGVVMPKRLFRTDC